MNHARTSNRTPDRATPLPEADRPNRRGPLVLGEAEGGRSARVFLTVALRLLAAITLTLLLAACAGEAGDTGDNAADASAAESAESGAEADAGITVSGVGFATPESVLHQRSGDVYLVSNINGAPLEKDGNGFISRVSPEGEVLELKWIDGQSEGVTLNAPKGMAFDDGILYVADIDCIRLFDEETGEARGAVCPEGATFINDVAPHPEAGVLVTDSGLDASFSPTGADALYHVVGTESAPVVRDPGFGAPNGVAIFGGEVYVVTFNSGQVFRVTGQDEMEEVLAVDGGQLDGIEFLVDGRALVSNWGTSCVHLLDVAGNLTCVMPDLEAPADIGVDHRRSRVLIPLFNADEVRILPIG